MEKVKSSKLIETFPQPEALKLIPEIMDRKYVAIPMAVVGNALRVAIANPQEIFALEALATQSQMRIVFFASRNSPLLQNIFPGAVGKIKLT